MPYIQNTEIFDQFFNDLPSPESAGELNYLITRLCLKYLSYHGEFYQTYNDISGAITNANLEFYRRMTSKYEDLKIDQNGDIFPSK